MGRPIWVSHDHASFADFAPKFRVYPPNFPVLGFGSFDVKALNTCIAGSGRRHPRKRARNLRISVFFSLVGGNLEQRPVRSGLCPQPGSPVSTVLCRQAAKIRADWGHLSDLASSPCGRSGNKRVISALCLRGQFFVSRFSGVAPPPVSINSKLSGRHCCDRTTKSA